jgi:hypothetical protein
VAPSFKGFYSLVPSLQGLLFIGSFASRAFIYFLFEAFIKYYNLSVFKTGKQL